MKLRDDEACIQRLLDGKLGEAEFQRVEDRLCTDAAFRRLYLSYVKSHHLLIEKFESSRVELSHLPAGPVLLRRRRAFFALAAAVAAMLTALVFVRMAVPEPRAELVYGPESRGRLDHPAGRVGGGSMWIGSVLDLERGSVSITLPSGVRGYIEGPGKLELQEANRLHLHAGRAWFEVPQGAEGFVCATNAFFVKDLGTEFGIIADPGQPEEVHVLKGKVRLHPIERPGEERELETGQGTAWKDNELAEPIRPGAFSTAFPEKIVVFHEDFSEADGTPLHGRKPNIGSGAWEVLHGKMEIRGGCVDTRGQHRNAAFAPLGSPRLDDLTHILLLTVEAEGPGDVGWAGVSLYTGNQERIFVGDPCGPDGDWALHPVGWQAINACPLLAGKSKVTLRYNYRTGLAELFEGEETTGMPLASQWIAPGLAFDRIRLANGSQRDAIHDTGVREEDVIMPEDVDVRSNITVRKIRVTVLSAVNTVRQPG